MQNPDVLSHTCKTLTSDKVFVTEVVGRIGSALKYLPEVFQKDRDVVMEAFLKDHTALQYAHNELKGDREFMLKAVAENGTALIRATETLRSDKDWLLVALATNGRALQVLGIFFLVLCLLFFFQIIFFLPGYCLTKKNSLGERVCANWY